MTNPNNPEVIQLDPEKVIEAFCRSKDSFMGRSSDYWAQVLTDHAQKIADHASIDEYDDWDLEAMGYER